MSLHNVKEERRFGLASVFTVSCSSCGEKNNVKTSSEHRSGQRGPPTYNINSRAVLGCLHTGIGNTHLNNLLSTLNVPTINPVTFKSREREIGTAVEKVARKSCLENMALERKLALDGGATADSDGFVSVSCSYDMGWQKRGRGHNSSTGHGAVMGLTTGKVLDFATKTKTCRICKNAMKAGKKVNVHDCRRNHSASSKAMEPQAAIDLFTRSLKSNVKLSVYTGDDDSTTAAHIKQKVPYPVEKWTDIVHAKRSLSTRLYNLAQRGKFANSSVLSQRVVSYLVKCFSYCITQNKGNPSALQKELKSIVPHAFGDHECCNESWCRAKQDPLNYKHSDLPYGKDLFGEQLQKSIQAIFDEYCTDLVVKKLSPAANSQRNEALNSIIGSKNPKIRFYGGSSSNDFRVACGISQANLGYHYISQTLDSLNIEPGEHCLNHIDKMEHKATQDKLRKSNLDFKRRRAQLHNNKLKTDGNKEAKEGPMYQSNIGLNLDPNKTDKVANEIDVNIKITKEELQQFEKFLPELTVRPVAAKHPFSRNNVYNFIIFDIETNTSGKTAEICQLSALDRSGLLQFNEYVLPSKDVDIHASRVNKLSVRRVNGTRTLCKEDNPVTSILIDKAIQNFLTFLQRTVQSVKSGDKQICTVLIGHNSQVFDTPTLLRQGGNQFCQSLSSFNVFFSDSLPLMKKLVKCKHPSLMSTDGSTVKTNQASIYQKLFNRSFPAHDAMEDVKALRKILFNSSLNISDEMLTEIMCTTKHAENDMKYLDHRHVLVQTFKGKLYHPTDPSFPVKQQIVEKIAGTGLSYQHLEDIFEKFGEKALIGVLSHPPASNATANKSPRVTKTKRILASIVEHFQRKKARIQQTENP